MKIKASSLGKFSGNSEIIKIMQDTKKLASWAKNELRCP
jgi:hypothetical protein